MRGAVMLLLMAVALSGAVHAEPTVAAGTADLLAVARGREAAGDLDGALRACHEAAKQSPSSAEVQYQLAHLLHRSGKLVEAIPLYRQVIEARPEDARLHYDLGAACQTLGMFDEAIASYRAALLHDPEFGAVYRNLGALLEKLGRLRDAAKAYQAALRLDPDDVELHRTLNALAEDSRRLERRALRRAQTLVALRPDDVAAYVQLASAYHKLGEFDAALDTLAIAARIDPDARTVADAMDAVREQRRQRDHALREQARKALEDDPRDPEALLSAVALLLRIGDAAAAVPWLTRAQNLAEGASQRARAWAALGDAYSAQGDTVSGIAAYRRSLAHVPHQPRLHRELGRDAFAKADWRVAREHLLMAAKQDPDDAVSQYHLARVYQRDGDWPRAMRHYHVAVRMKPDYVLAYLGLARAYEAGGLLPAAHSNYDRFLGLAAHRPDLENERARVFAQIEGTGSGGRADVGDEAGW